MGFAFYIMRGNVFADVLDDRLGDIASANNETTFAQAVLDFSIPLSIFCVIALSVKSAYEMITSQGNPEKLNEARETITNAILGFGLIAMSVAILLLIEDIFDLPTI